MAYEFSGFFIRIDNLDHLDFQKSEDLQVRLLEDPFRGAVIRLRQASLPRVSQDKVLDVVKSIGAKAIPWLYIEYCTWGGTVDSVRGFVSDGRSIRSFEDDDLTSVEGTFIELMDAFGIPEEDALNFPPFHRGFWLS